MQLPRAPAYFAFPIAMVYSNCLPSLQALEGTTWKRAYRALARKVGFKVHRPHGAVVLLALFFLTVFLIVSVFAMTQPNPATRTAITAINLSLAGILMGIFALDIVVRKVSLKTPCSGKVALIKRR